MLIRFGFDFDRFGAPKTRHIAEGDSAWRGLEVDLFLACYRCHILVASKTAQEAPKRPQDPSKTTQEAPKRPQDPPQERPKRVHEAKLPPQDAPRGFQETPKAGQEGSIPSKNAPRGSKRHRGRLTSLSQCFRISHLTSSTCLRFSCNFLI